MQQSTLFYNIFNINFGAKFIYHKNKRVGFDFIIIQLSKEIK